MNIHTIELFESGISLYKLINRNPDLDYEFMQNIYAVVQLIFVKFGIVLSIIPCTGSNNTTVYRCEAYHPEWYPDTDTSEKEDTHETLAETYIDAFRCIYDELAKHNFEPIK